MNWWMILAGPIFWVILLFVSIKILRSVVARQYQRYVDDMKIRLQLQWEKGFNSGWDQAMIEFCTKVELERAIEGQIASLSLTENRKHRRRVVWEAMKQRERVS